MVQNLFIPALLTGFFCAVFAVGIDYVTDMLERNQIILFSFTSGFLGSLFARLVLGKGKTK